MSNNRSHENQALNAIRSCSAIAVVIVHVRDALLLSRQDFHPSRITEVDYALTGFGHGAVLVFFVLSGYFVGGSVLASNARGRFDWRRYSISRLTRLWIVLIPALCVTLVADTVGRHLSPAYIVYAGHQGGSAAQFLGNALFLQGSFVAPFGSNGALWSLAYEAFYYALFPLVLVGVLRTRGRVRFVSVILSVLVVLTASRQIWILFPIWLIGALLAHQEQRIRRLLSGWSSTRMLLARMAALGLLGASLIADKLQSDGATSVSLSSYAVGLFAAALVALLFDDLRPRRWIAKVALQRASGYAHSSYSLYAVHMPLLYLAVAIVNPARRRPDLWYPSATAWFGVVIVVAALLAAGWVFAQATERHTDRVRGWLTTHLTPASDLGNSPHVERSGTTVAAIEA
jgi:peptidoglycan/LPS O-acetylase OafA/YrhL